MTLSEMRILKKEMQFRSHLHDSFFGVHVLYVTRRVTRRFAYTRVTERDIFTIYTHKTVNERDEN